MVSADAQPIHLSATGPALALVEAHQAPQDLVFYSGWFCPFNQRVWVALEEKGIKYQYKEVNPYRKEAAFLAVNPKGLVPAVEHRGQAMYESSVLLEYLDEAFPETRALLPSSPTDRALARIQIDYISKKVIPTYFKLLLAQAVDAQEDARKDLVDSLRELSNKVKGPFYSGEEFGAVDITFATFFMRIYTLEEHRNFKLSDAGPKFVAWHQACTTRPSLINTTSERKYYDVLIARYLSNEATSEVAKSTRGEKSHA